LLIAVLLIVNIVIDLVVAPKFIFFVFQGLKIRSGSLRVIIAQGICSESLTMRWSTYW
jgi:hypothetical protein